MALMRHTGFVLSLMLVGYLSIGQSQTTDEKVKTEFKISANYNTGLNYYGRVDSLRSSGFFPLAELWFNESFYINAAPVFVNNSVESFQYAGMTTSAGYLFNSKNKWLGNIYVVKPFYLESTDLVQSALKAQTGMTFTWLNKIINVTGGGDIKFSDKTDYGITGGLDHIIRYQLNDKTVLVIDPSAFINAGTQQFTRSYLKRANGFLVFPGSEQVVTESAQKFNILSYEFSVPMIMAINKFQLLFTPAYVIPQNLLTVEGRPDLSEKGEKMFYATFGAKMSF
jgi:hypothetical protein